MRQQEEETLHWETTVLKKTREIHMVNFKKFKKSFTGIISVDGVEFSPLVYFYYPCVMVLYHLS